MFVCKKVETLSKSKGETQRKGNRWSICSGVEFFSSICNCGSSCRLLSWKYVAENLIILNSDLFSLLQLSEKSKYLILLDSGILFVVPFPVLVSSTELRPF